MVRLPSWWFGLLFLMMAVGCVAQNNAPISEDFIPAAPSIPPSIPDSPPSNEIPPAENSEPALPSPSGASESGTQPLSETENTNSTQRIGVEFPSDSEKVALPECDQAFFSVYPVDLSKVYEITPLGSLTPPGHTFPTEHTFFHFQPGNASTTLFTLSAPADIYITNISGGPKSTQDPFDYTIYFALCKDVVGYYNHVKELSPELMKIKANGSCNRNPGNADYEFCEIHLDAVKKGTAMGKVGRLQGNFDFGLMDLRKKNQFVNPTRYGARSHYIQCPFDYYAENLQKPFFDLIERNDAKQCGEVMQDIPGTLQGNWFYGNARADMGGDWDKYLAFVHDNQDPSIQVISVGGKFTDVGKWDFAPKNTGNTNRNFSQVAPGSALYCYKSENQDGRIIVQLVSETELKIERQDGGCSVPFAFNNPTLYQR